MALTAEQRLRIKLFVAQMSDVTWGESVSGLQVLRMLEGCSILSGQRMDELAAMDEYEQMAFAEKTLGAWIPLIRQWCKEIQDLAESRAVLGDQLLHEALGDEL